MICLPDLAPGTGTVLAGLFAATVASASWLAKSAVSGYVWYYGRLSREIERMVALVAEIKTNLEFQRRLGSSASLEATEAALTRDPAHKFFVPLYREDIVFDRLKSDITDLPAGPIHDVIDYYNHSNGLDVVLERLETDRYEAFSVERRIRIARSLNELACDTVTSGEKAIASLEDQLVRSRTLHSGLLGLGFGATAISIRLAWDVVGPIGRIAERCLGV